MFCCCQAEHPENGELLIANQVLASDGPTLLAENAPAVIAEKAPAVPGVAKLTKSGSSLMLNSLRAKSFEERKELEKCQKPRLLLISDNLPAHQILACAVKASTVPVVVRYSDWGIEDLILAIRELAGEPAKQYASVGLLDHGAEGVFCLLKQVAGGDVDLKDVRESEELQHFFKFIAGYVQAPKELHSWRRDLDARIDLMACSVAGSKEGMELITYLEDLTRVNWAASVDKTGNAADGYDWDMETEEGLAPVSSCYFAEHRLAEWHECAGLWDVVAGVASGVGDTVVNVAAAGAEVASVVTKPAADVVGAVGCAVLGSCKFKVWNDMAIPILVTFSNIGGIHVEAFRKVQPSTHSHQCLDMPPVQQKAVWISVDGKMWYYQHHNGYENCRVLTARDVLENPWGPPQDFVGFNLGSALSAAAQLCEDFIRARLDELKAMLERALDGFKHALEHANLKQLQDFSRPRGDGVAPKKYAKDKKKAAAKGKHKASADGMTTFESYFSQEDARKTDASGKFHRGVHELRADGEAIRFALMDVYGSFDDLHGVLDTPHQVKGEIAAFRKPLSATKMCMSKVKLSGAGPVGSIVNGVKTGVEQGIGALEHSLKAAEKSLDGVDQNLGLVKKKKALKEYQHKLKEKAPFAKFEKVNHTLAALEEQSSTFSDEWPKLKPKLPEAVAKEAEKEMRSAEHLASAVKGKLTGVADHSRRVSEVLGPLHAVATKKDELVKACSPVKDFMEKLETALMIIYEKVLKPILELPIVKDILAWASKLCDWLINKIMEFTQLDKLAGWLADKCNPFAAFIEDYLKEIKRHVGVELALDASPALKSLEDATGIQVPNLKDLKSKAAKAAKASKKGTKP
uniref:DUF4347 domain-containing protein n=1 Tax=Zooxanthella nutricula TaxID=1333877 RepID=A0A7S2KQQ6_9DINO